MKTNVGKYVAIGFCGLYVAACVAGVVVPLYELYKADKEREKLHIINDEFGGDEELYERYKRGDVIDVEVV